MPAPIILFVYDRPEHTRRTLEALAANDLADESRLVVFSDGPRDGARPEDRGRVEQVRQIIRERDWCAEVVVVERNVNWGLARNIVAGVTRVTTESGRVVVLEDDIVTGKGFLRYMNEALDLYAEDPEVMHISGFMHPIEVPARLGSTFFYNVTSCWGWATWERAWRHYEPDPAVILRRLRAQQFDAFTFNGGQGTALLDQLQSNASGALDTWAAKWHASVYLAGGACLHPRTAVVTNIGFDGSGTNCGATKPKGIEDYVAYVSPEPKARTDTQIDSHRTVSELMSSRQTRPASGRSHNGLRSMAARIRRACRRLLLGGP